MAIEILFDETLLDPGLFTLGDATGSPELANTMAKSPTTGAMKVNISRYDPQHVWNFDFKMIQGGNSAEMDYFNHMWYGGWGSAFGFRVRIETDRLLNQEVLGTSDGTIASRTWKLAKKYNRPGTSLHPYNRYICKPVVSTNLEAGSVTLYEPNGVTPRVIENPFVVYFGSTPQPTGWTINNTTGILKFAATPTIGTIIKVTSQFDTPMRFFSNSFQQKADFPAEIKGIQLIEILPHELGL